nr:replication protein A 70 kDa DNA-binding subunit B-like [Ipomoea batatas]
MIVNIDLHKAYDSVSWSFLEDTLNIFGFPRSIIDLLLYSLRESELSILIDNRNTTAAMRLRLIRTYDIVQSRYSDKVRSRECVFHDEEGSYVHLNIPGNNVSVTNSFIEGHVYCIKNFLVPTKIPKEIESLVGRGMVFKINVQRDRLEKRNLPFPVMQIKEDIAVLNQYCPGLVKDTKQKGTTSIEPLDDDLDSDAMKRLKVLCQMH